MKKPVRLEINTAGGWKVIARFDADDTLTGDAVLDSAAQLATDLACAGTRCTLRVSLTEPPHLALMYWSGSDDSGWRDARTGEPV